MAPRYDVETSVEVIRTKAAQGQFVCYGDLALGAWEMGHMKVYANSKGWPMLSAIVTSQGFVASGNLSKGALNSFIDDARELGHRVADDESARLSFLEREQRRVFRWARAGTD
jgi:hypothetical protein